MLSATISTIVSSLPTRLLFTYFLVFSFPAFTLQLALDLNTGQWVGSPVMKATTLASELFVFAIILSSRKLINFIIRCWPILVLISVSFISAAWSINPKATIHASNTFMTAILLGLAIVGAFPQFQSIRFCIRVMVLGCVLSIAWVLIFPKAGIHQLTDPFQTVHAGLWRGIFSHKQGLGVFAGLTTGLLLFYGTSIFRLPLFLFSLACSLTCLVNTESATGIVVAVITPAFLYISYFITRFPPESRNGMLLILAFCIVAVIVGYKMGVFDYVIVHILGRHTDLTGREDFWRLALTNFYSSGLTLLGGGFGGNLASYLIPGSVDNGYLDIFIEFGYVFSFVIFLTFAAIFWNGFKLVRTTPSKNAMTNVFPLAIWSVVLILNITESDFMTKCIETVLTSVAVGLIHQYPLYSSQTERKKSDTTTRLFRKTSAPRITGRHAV